MSSSMPTGCVEIKRISAPDSGATVTIPDQASRAIIRNTGAYDIRISKEGAEADQYFTLKTTDEPVSIGVTGGSVLEIDGDSGDSYLEIWCWG